MALIAAEVIGLARVSIAYPGPRSPAVGTYDFSNGFDAVSVKGAQPGAAVVANVGPGIFALFLSEPVAPGVMATQGGLKATIDAVAVSTASAPAPTVPPVTLRWYYGAYNLGGLYQNVDPEKVIVIEATDPLNEGNPFEEPFTFDISVVRDPMTEFVAKQFVG